VVGRVGKLVAATVFDVHAGDAERRQFGGQGAGGGAEAGLDVDGDRYGQVCQAARECEGLVSGGAGGIRSPMYCGDTEAGGADRREARGDERCGRGDIPGVGQHEGLGSVVQTAERQRAVDESQGVFATRAGVASRAERCGRQVDVHLLAVGRDAAGGRHGGRRPSDHRRRGVAALDEQTDPGCSRFIPATSTCLDEPFHRGIGFRCLDCVWLIRTRHGGDIGDEVGRGCQPERGCEVRDRSAGALKHRGVDTGQEGLDEVTAAEVGRTLAEAHHGGAQPGHTLRCRRSVYHGVSRIIEQAHDQNRTTGTFRSAPNCRGHQNGGR